MARRALVVGVLFVALAFAPRPASASIILGGTIEVATTGPVDAKFLFSDAAFNSDLFLSDPANALGFFFDNHTTLPGTTMALGNFTAGTELIFGLRVDTLGFGGEIYNVFTGPGGLNPDGLPKALIIDDPFNDLDPGTLAFLVGLGLVAGETIVAFEDVRVGGPLSPPDNDYNDHIFAFSNVTAVPEPATLLLFGTAAVGVLARRRTRK